MREAGIAARREAAAPQSTAAIPWSTNTSIGSSSVSSIICGLAHALFDPGHSVPWSAFAGDYDWIRNAVARVTRHTSLADHITKSVDLFGPHARTKHVARRRGRAQLAA
jgi:hypothetical protein